jgi:CRISPR-associated endonuclease/helicase Cas3
MGQALWHQVAVYQQAATADIILDLAPTGTGKTKAGLLTLLHNPDRHAAYIAPTNALVEQQAEAATTFLREAGLPHLVLPADAAKIRHANLAKIEREFTHRAPPPLQ